MGLFDSGLGGFVSSIFGSKNKVHADAPKIDANAYQYGGTPNGANDAAGRYQQTGQLAQYRQGAQAGYAGADQAYAQSQQARQGQASLASRMDARAAGQVPSIAGMQAQQDAQRAQAAQMSAAASARGPAGIALAQQQAANNTANAQAQISGQAQVNAANERLQAEQAASNAYGAMRGGDQQSQGQLAQQSQFNAQLNQNQHALNDQMQLGMTQAEMGVRNAEMTGQMNQQAQASANALGATGINAGVAGQNASMNQQNSLTAVGAGQKGAGAAATMARGGRLPAGHRAIVGEEGPERLESGDQRGLIVGQHGPELIIPKHDSVVIPNELAFPPNAINHASFPPGTPTWGNKKAPAPAANLNSPYYYDERDARLSSTGAMAVPGFSPGTHTTADQPMRQMDQDLISKTGAQKAEGLDVSDEDQRKTDAAAYRERRARGVDAGRDPNLAPEAPKKATLASRLAESGDQTMRDATRIDVGYHGPGGGYVPPQLIPIGGGRAMGGPVDAGVPYMVGEQGPEALVPTSGPGAPGSVQAPSVHAPTIAEGGPRTAVQSWKGAAEERNNGAFALMGYSPSQANAIRNPNGRINNFEDGGEAKGGKPAVVGEDGAEIVVEAPKEPTWRGSSLARAMASRKSQEGPAAVPLADAGNRELHQSAEGHAFYAAPPSTTDGGASLEAYAAKVAAAKTPAPAAGAAPPPPPPPKARPRKMTPEEMMAAADAMGAQQQSAHEARMASGPAVRMPVDLERDASGQPVAAYVPSPNALEAPPEGYAPSPHALPAPPPREQETEAAYTPSQTALPPPGAERWGSAPYYVIPKEMPYTMSTRGGGLARAMRRRR